MGGKKKSFTRKGRVYDGEKRCVAGRSTGKVFRMGTEWSDRTSTLGKNMTGTVMLIKSNFKGPAEDRNRAGSGLESRTSVTGRKTEKEGGDFAREGIE